MGGLVQELKEGGIMKSRDRYLWMVMLLAMIFWSWATAWSEPVEPIMFYSKAEKGLWNRTYTLRFSLWDAGSGGNRLWEEEKILATKGSVITTYLGEVNPITGVDFSQALWVQVEKRMPDGNYVEIGERDELTVVSYAMYALTPAGPKGEKGDQGTKGDAGPQGLQGPQGLTGSQGAAGPQGSMGPQGPGGTTGATGPQGPQGLAGSQGPQGLIGPLGPQGLTGPQGLQGPTGATGSQGPQGFLGPIGMEWIGVFDSGVTYDQRDGVSFAGSSYISLIDANLGNQPDVSPFAWGVLALVGGQGIQGPQGPGGGPGPQGPTGATGATGAIGPSGSQGIQGLTGATGATGAIGPAGSQGVQGLTGATGTTGAQGTAGPQGAQGSQGPAGQDGARTYTGNSPVSVSNTLNTIGLNAATNAGDLMTWDGSHWIAQQPAVHTFPQDSNMQPYTTINFQIATEGYFPSRNAIEPYLGEIMMVGYNFETNGWLFCNGQLLSISQYSALFSLLGTTYGGNGTTTFGLPDLRGRVPMHFGQGPGLQNRYLGEMGGAERISW
jgi:microcystin-dependent protein